jgi:hypothetical protein
MAQASPVTVFEVTFPAGSVGIARSGSSGDVVVGPIVIVERQHGHD